MKVLFVTNMYPHKKNPYYGIFVKEQIEAIKKIENIDDKLYFIEGYKSKLEYLKSIFLINWLVFRWKPDIIHVHYGLSGLFLLFNPFIAKKTVVTPHGGDILIEQGNNFQVWLTKVIVRKVAFVFLLNDEMMNIIKPINPETVLLKCGVDTDLFNCNKAMNQEENEASKKNITLIFPSDKKRKVKDFPLFLRAFNLCQKIYPEFTFSYEEVTGMSREEVQTLFCGADCMVMTSISEGSPQVIKEAMACNLPIVSVNVGDVKNVLANVENCYVSTNRDEKELVKLIGKVINSAKKRSNGREELINQNLNNSSIANRILEKYKQVL